MISIIQTEIDKILYLDFSKERTLKNISKREAFEAALNDWVEKCKKERKG